MGLRTGLNSIVGKYLFIGSPKRSGVRKTAFVLLARRVALLSARFEKISAVLTSVDLLLHVILRFRITLHRQH